MYSNTEQITNNINELQADILLESTSNNPLFTTHTIETLNKSLKTTKKDIVHAINELKKDQGILDATVKNNLNKQFEAIGDIVSSADVKAKLESFGTNIIDALYNAKNQITTLDNKAKTTTKDIVFVMPKAIVNGRAPEIYFPYNGYISSIAASVSATNNTNRSEEDADIEIGIEHYYDSVWTELTSITIPKDKTFALKNITNDTSMVINAKRTRIKIKSVPENGDTLDLSVTVTLVVSTT